MADEPQLDPHPFGPRWRNFASIAKEVYYIGSAAALVLAGLAGLVTGAAVLIPRIAPFWSYLLVFAVLLLPIPAIWWFARKANGFSDVAFALLRVLVPYCLGLILYAGGEYAKLIDFDAQTRVVTALEKDSRTASHPVTITWREQLNKTDRVGLFIRFAFLFFGTMIYCIAMMAVVSMGISEAEGSTRSITAILNRMSDGATATAPSTQE